MNSDFDNRRKVPKMPDSVRILGYVARIPEPNWAKTTRALTFGADLPFGEALENM